MTNCFRLTGMLVLQAMCLTSLAGNTTNGTIPRRFPYPLAESNTNPVNYKAASDAVPGGDNLMGRVWWAKP